MVDRYRFALCLFLCFVCDLTSMKDVLACLFFVLALDLHPVPRLNCVVLCCDCECVSIYLILFFLCLLLVRRPIFDDLGICILTSIRSSSFLRTFVS